MVDINPNAAGLQTQLQAQLQAKAGRTAKPVQRVQDQQTQRGESKGASESRQLVTSNPRTGGLSSDAEIEAASDRVARFGVGQREAPIGRLSEQAQGGRNVPLGQIVDIRV